ncbi:MAG: chalcone isomerase family protein [Chromatiales bacterium]|jgi:hypothetical protein
MRKLAVIIVLMLFFMQAQGREVAGVDLPEKVKLEGDTTSLVLNGAGIRKKLFFSIYLASLPSGTVR